MSISDERLAELIGLGCDGIARHEACALATEVQALRAAAKVRAIREGDGEWVMVPREPTQEMIAAGSEARPYIEEGERDELTDRNTEGTYAAMIAASPAATGGEKDNG